MAENNQTEIKTAVKPVVEAANKKNSGDILVQVEARYLEHDNAPFKQGDNVWMSDDAAKFHASHGSVKRIA